MFVALVYMLRSIAAIATIAFLATTFLSENPQWLIGVGISFGLLILTAAIHLAEASKNRCPVCTTPLFARTTCSKHRTAGRLFGSYRFHTAFEILSTPRYHCHHCGEGVSCRSAEAEAATPKTRRRRPAASYPRVPISELPQRPQNFALHARTEAEPDQTSLPS